MVYQKKQQNKKRKKDRNISLLLPFTEMPRHGKSEETSLLITREWPFVPANKKWDRENTEMWLIYVACNEQYYWPKNVVIISL